MWSRRTAGRVRFAGNCSENLMDIQQESKDFNAPPGNFAEIAGLR